MKATFMFMQFRDHYVRLSSITLMKLDKTFITLLLDGGTSTLTIEYDDVAMAQTAFNIAGQTLDAII